MMNASIFVAHCRKCSASNESQLQSFRVNHLSSDFLWFFFLMPQISPNSLVAYLWMRRVSERRKKPILYATPC